MFKKFKKFLLLSFMIKATLAVASGESVEEYRTPEERKNLFKRLGVEYMPSLIPHSDFSKQGARLEALDVDNRLIEDEREARQRGVRLGQAEREKAMRADSFVWQNIVASCIASVFIKKVNERVGYGVFANEDLRPNTFVGEYTGKIVDSKDHRTTTYLFDYPVTCSTNPNCQYVIDAQLAGNETRFVNDSGESSNCKIMNFVGLDSLVHVVFLTNQFVKSNEQLTIDYGPFYWRVKGNAFQDFSK